MITGDFEISAEPFVSRYRVVAHDGAPDAKLLDALWQDYAQPIRVRVMD